MRTCRYCGNKYEDNWSNWYNKLCCSNCFKNKNSKYNVDDKVYSYYNQKDGRNGILTAVCVPCNIATVITMYRPTDNGLYQYKIRYYNDKHDKMDTSYRFVHQIFETEQQCKDYVNKLNNKRIVIHNTLKNLQAE